MGRTEIEDALKKLDKLTQEEARMAAAQNLKATHAVDERVKGVADAVVTMDNRVAGVDDRVVGVSDQVAGVDNRVVNVTDQVAGVDDRVASVSGQVASVGDRVQQTANDVDQVKRSSSYFSADHGLMHSFREPIAREHSQMAFPTGSLDEPQHRMWYSSQERSNLVLSRQHLSGLEIIRIASLGPWKTFASSSLQLGPT